MKTFKFFAMALVAMFALSLSAQAQNPDKKGKAKYAEVTFVTSIDCDNCRKKLEANLPFIKGVKDVKVDLATRAVWFKYSDDKVTKEALKKEIEKLGYTAQETAPEAVKGNAE